MNKTQPILDRVAITASSLCALHCVALPIATAFFPAVLSASVDDHLFHQLLVLAVIPTSIIAILMGCRKHKDKVVFLLGITGVSLLVIIAFFGHQILGETGEKAGTLLSSLLIVVAHMRNYFLCQEDICTH